MKLKVCVKDQPYWLVLDLDAEPRVSDLMRLIKEEVGQQELKGEKEGLFVDGNFVEFDTLLEMSHIFEGSQISISPTEKVESDLLLATTGGVNCGDWIGVTASPKIIGRSQMADLQIECPAVSPRHLLVKINPKGQPELLDLDSQNGAWVSGTTKKRVTSRTLEVDNRIQIGNSFLEFLNPPKTSQKNTKENRDTLGFLPVSKTPFAKSALLDLKPYLEPLEIPFKDKSAKSKISFSWATLLAPVLFGCIMAVLFSPYMALFILLSPLMSVGSWMESKFRRRRSRIMLGKYSRRQIQDFSKNLAAHRDLEILKRQKERLDPARAWWSIQNGWLWQAQASNLFLGSCDLKWRPSVDDRNQQHLEEAILMLDNIEPLPDVPLKLEADSNIVLGIVGSYPIVASLARWLILQSAIQYRPTSLGIKFAGGFLARDWEWMEWLPHFNSPSPNQLVLVDLYKNLTHIDFQPSENRVILLAPTPQQLPSGCTAVIHIQDLIGNATISFSDGSSDSFKVDGILKSFATKCARGIARYKDFQAPTPYLPKQVGLGQILKLDTLTQWEETSNQAVEGNLSIPIGMADEPMLLDLVNDGPHGLVAGTTGSGKSELLRTIVASLAQVASPQLINFVLIDYKGGSTFDMLSDLPHTVSIITDLNPELGQRALIALRAELTNRENILREAKAENLTHFYKIGGKEMARLLILVDEFASLAEERPEFLNSLVEVARRGRSLGVHLILSTQRPQGIINANILANTNFRICLRTLSEADSLDVLGTPEAAFLPKEIPGRACLKIGMDPPQIFQAGQANSVTHSYKDSIELYKVSDMRKSLDPTDIEKIVTATRATAKRLGLPAPPKPIPDPLPEHLDIADWMPVSKREKTIKIGLVDKPEKQTLEILEWEPKEGNLGLVGNKSVGWLESLTIQFAKQIPDSQIFILDWGQDISLLAELPQCSARATPQNIELKNQIIEFLKTRLKSQNQCLVVVNNLEGFWGDLEQAGNFSNIEEINRLILEGPSVGVYWMLGTGNITNSSRLIQKRTKLRIYSNLKSPSDFLEAGIMSRDGISDINSEILGDTRQLVRLISCANPKSEIKKVKKAKVIKFETLPEKVEKLKTQPQDLHLPFGLMLDASSSSLETAAVDISQTRHFLISGPATSGKSTALFCLAQAATQNPSLLIMLCLCPSSSPLASNPNFTICAESVEDLAKYLQESEATTTTILLFIDDAHLFGDSNSVLYELARNQQVHIFAAARNDLLHRCAYPWINEVKVRKAGLLLDPDPLDGEFFSLKTSELAKYTKSKIIGRAIYICDSTSRICQIAKSV